ncbi:MAG: glycosyltransferase family 2 protein [Candidatus Hydrogenedentes bacterium]|nr:glycosyltransferase family 2 protein [Candidatus Hydrogenedentota bacterium]
MSVHDVTVIVVTYNTREMTQACLTSLREGAQELSIEIIVIDNASEDGSADMIRKDFPGAALISSEQNHGFAGANNLAAREARGKYVLLLNPDTLVLNSAIDRLVAFAEAHPEASIFGGRTFFGDGTLNPASCFRAPSLWGLFCRAVALDVTFPDSVLFNPDCYGGWARDTVREVDIVSGCFLLIRSGLWRELGGFDTDYFMYGEDWDLCMRARALGHKCLICPEAEIVHYGGASEPLQDGRIVRLLQTKVLLFRKRWGKLRRMAGVALLSLWVIVRLVGYGASCLILGVRCEEYGCWKRIWAARSQWRA